MAALCLFTCLVAHDYRPVTLVTLAVSIICSSLFIVRCFAPVLAQLTALPEKPYQMSGAVPPGVSGYWFLQWTICTAHGSILLQMVFKLKLFHLDISKGPLPFFFLRKQFADVQLCV